MVSDEQFTSSVYFLHTASGLLCIGDGTEIKEHFYKTKDTETESPMINVMSNSNGQKCCEISLMEHTIRDKRIHAYINDA